MSELNAHTDRADFPMLLLSQKFGRIRARKIAQLPDIISEMYIITAEQPVRAQNIEKLEDVISEMYHVTAKTAKKAKKAKKAKTAKGW